MRIEANVYSRVPSALAKASGRQDIIATGTGISIEDRNTIRRDIKKNDPTNPLVSKKILDSLDLGFIDFNQEERDVLATIMRSSSFSGPEKF